MVAALEWAHLPEAHRAAGEEGDREEASAVASPAAHPAASVVLAAAAGARHQIATFWMPIGDAQTTTSAIASLGMSW